MNKREFENTLEKVYQYRKHLLNTNLNKEVEKYIRKKYKLINYSVQNYEKDLNTLRSFDVNLIYDKSFWKLKVSDSICAVAGVVYPKYKQAIS